MNTVDVTLQLTAEGLVRRVLAPATRVGFSATSQVPVVGESGAVEVAKKTAFATAKERAALAPLNARLDPSRREWIVTFERVA
ncbi:Uncharacterised protein (plasmid) [Tsukamurella tyrosinosolvens]|uniref:Uncharacterized protein n=1 Tax=Tsukamurella tyrosinosolvens TaxID=57704 RepID=A0A1H4U7I5_TSUTY|nr:hypothetical protein [Tsukamurella tyrosinosolvens]KXO93004.1 hypothetical protein AXK58_14130 [Tsukamurella tyrosinosolvens]SEC64732.1 hypothetical protein SAMN04489793_2806 [Tsukamurella tyrosinosolvens]VEH94040.1 Uncharacterised protein [Tsukamurella tyrosinosolvens]